MTRIAVLLPILVASLTIPFATGCEDWYQSTKTGIEAREEAKVVARVERVKGLIAGFDSTHGRLPKSLDELEGVPELPEGYHFEYDPRNGKVSAVRE